ncbi:hypothetical protein B0O99DRAFT_507277 [Bisporella sp. PMI_857]|nr:hypothetical protein B0O99DRAFT_507277 [Bisporella sp. PMI_857]
MAFPLSSGSWTTALLSSLALLGTLVQPTQATTTPETVKGYDADGNTIALLAARYPALYTGDFGDCMGGQSLVNLTAFDAAYYKDNSTILFHMRGTTNLRNESLMDGGLLMSLDGEDRYDHTFNPCEANFDSLCPMMADVPISGGAVIPVSKSDVSSITDIALSIPDFEGSTTLRIFSNATQTQIGCFKAVMTNGATFSHPKAIGSALAVFTVVALLSSFFTAAYGVGVPNIRVHYAHSLSILVIFEVFQSIFFSGALSINWPSVCAAFWSNFGWSAGQIYTSSIINSVNKFTGVNGNSSQVGGAGSTFLNTNGGLQQQIYGRSLPHLWEYSSPEMLRRGEEFARRIYNRAENQIATTPKLYEWAGVPVSPGLPLPGNWSGFAGELVDLGIPVADAFLVGFLWFLILIAILIGAIIAFKYTLELLSSIKWIKADRLTFFRSHWLGFLGLIVLRGMLIAFFMMMTLTLFQFSNGGKAGPIAIAVIVFAIFFAGALGIAFYACFYRAKFGKYESQPDRVYFHRKKIWKFIPYVGTTRESSLGENDDKPATSGSIPFPRIQFVSADAERQSVHEDADYTKRFGWLSARYRRTRWWFFAFWIVYQFVRACFVGGARASPTAQVIGLFVWEIIAFVTIIRINPYESARNTSLAVYLLGFSKVATAGLSIAFLPQINLPRIPATVVGVVIIVIQGFLVIGLLILIVLSVISSYMSLMRNREEFKPRHLENIKMKYFKTIEKKATDLPPTPPPLPEEPKEPYFTVNSVYRAPKIEDEDVDNVPDMYDIDAPPPVGRASRSNSMASRYSNVPYGARLHRASWSSRDFQTFAEDNGRFDSPIGPSRAGSALGHNSTWSSTSHKPLVRPILTSRKYGVATIWLVATLGQKSTTRKVTRKAILDVDVQRACETIIEPEAPMALRLQSNLMYGVSRVYDQQCGYVLSDAQAAQHAMRALLKLAKGDDLDINAGKSRPNHLMLMDDPAFDPNIALPALEFDFESLQAGDSQHSSQSMLSVRGRSGSVNSSHAHSVIGIDLPSSDGKGRPYHLPDNDIFGGSSAHKGFSTGGPNMFDDEAELFKDDIFGFDADGNMQDVVADEQDIFPTGTVPPLGRIGSDSAAKARVRKEHEDAVAGHVLPILDAEGDFDMLYDDRQPLPDGEPFPMMTGGLGGNDQPRQQNDSEDRVYSEEPSSLSAEAPQKRYKPKSRKILTADNITELLNRDLLGWQHGYLENMDKAKREKAEKIANSQSKKTAFSFVYGAGLSAVGRGIGTSNITSPLEMFSGASLFAKITGGPLPAKGKKATKRARESEDEKRGSSPKRSRHDGERELEADGEMGRGNYEDEGVMIMDDSIGTEVGRDAPPGLQDYPSSAMMPWNVSQSVHSHQLGASSSIPGRLPSVASRRPTSASPLLGRGAPLPSDLGQFDMEDEPVMYGRSDNDDDAILRVKDEDHNDILSSQAATAEFEIYGPAAQVDTQTAASSQWVREALDRESGNFLDYVRNSITEKFGVEAEADELSIDERRNCVTFEELFNPANNSRIVASQAFYHVLSLATKRKIWVEQDIDGKADGYEPFGEIRISAMV